MSNLEFIDCNCMIGRRNSPCFFEPEDTNKIKTILVKNKIKRALTYHSLSVEYHPIEGNMMLLDEILNDDFFIPVWVVMPNSTGEFIPTDDLKHIILGNGIKALRMAPSAEGLNYSVAKWSMGPIYELAHELKLPLMIDSDQISWNELYEVLNWYPDINFILTKIGYRSARYIYPIMSSCNNLHIDISMYKNHMGIEHLCKFFGSDRLLFGTGMPFFSPGSAKAMIFNADVDIKDKQNIAGNNILRLIGEVVKI